ncbi:hypothetical protein T02_2133 [Trichinella nativa]|uniref:Uncharacterized protein n=1 Tax=Trichinella nativa TaxID=6335 RepID=A0A0V1KVE3_9BILA|nr:hypothetical protein T02_2133 [Trichinella nativa]
MLLISFRQANALRATANEILSLEVYSKDRSQQRVYKTTKQTDGSKSVTSHYTLQYDGVSFTVLGSDHDFAGSKSTSDGLKRVKTPRAVQNQTDRTIPSLLGWSSVITPVFQRLRGTVSSVSRDTKYSSVYRFHSWRISICWYCQRLLSCLAPAKLDFSWVDVGSAANSLPIRKCAGVSRVQSLGSSLAKYGEQERLKLTRADLKVHLLNVCLDPDSGTTKADRAVEDHTALADWYIAWCGKYHVLLTRPLSSWTSSAQPL